MDWLTHNPLADMYGPVFLAFYAAVVTLTVVTCWLGRRALDWTGSMTAPAVPLEPDPFEVAYLRGGENEVARSIIFTLVQKGVLQVKQEGDDFLVSPAAAPATAERRNLSPIERRTLDWFAAPQKVSRIFKDDGLAPQLKPFCAAYEQRLRRENFLPTPEMLGGARLLRWACALMLAGLASYKILIALSRGRFNVLFLLALAAVGLFLIFRVSRTPRLTGRGRAYLERLQLAFERLKNRPAVAGGPSPLATQPLAPAAGGPALAAYDPTLPLLVGVFGVTALAGTQYDYFQQSFRRSAADGGASSGSSGCGSSCGSSDSSSDGSSSSDGGGSSCGSSCGGCCGGGGCGS